jgi:hypothetical protein
MSDPIRADIFATKGVEYILILVFLVAFVLFIRLLFRGSRKPDSGSSDDRPAGSA